MFSRSHRIFEIFGFEIKLDPSWLILAVLIIWSLSGSYFPAQVAGLGNLDYIALAVAAMLGLFACLILHELAHSLVARRFDLHVGGITLFLFGGVAELDEEPATAQSEFWIAVAGPTMSFALAGLAWLILRLVDAASLSPALSALLGYLAMINLLLALFNLVPAFPLDGGRVFRAALWYWFGDVVRATQVASKVASFFAIGMIAMGLLSLFNGIATGGLWLVLIGLYLQMAARTTLRQMQLRIALQGKTVSDMMTSNPQTVDVDTTIEALVAELMLPKTFTFVPVVDGDQLLGYLDSAMLRSIARDNWGNVQVGDIYEPATPENTVHPDLATTDLLQRMTDTGRRKYLVARDQRLIGVISLTDLMSYLSVLQDFGLQNGLPQGHANGGR
ncbi:site-2 protease family protein [Roseovarius arcticus]|uniref:site-2 protease family protein n=1 Tax=Roseovarius arcticus TaxID=2547404 RepID=UPI0011100037|nr:site-2 protease family protein [Roseovarius arcticus]